jgi:hypothetical protein
MKIFARPARYPDGIASPFILGAIVALRTAPYHRFMSRFRIVLVLLVLLTAFFSATYVDSAWLRDWAGLAEGVE